MKVNLARLAGECWRVIRCLFIHPCILQSMWRVSLGDLRGAKTVRAAVGGALLALSHAREITQTLGMHSPLAKWGI